MSDRSPQASVASGPSNQPAGVEGLRKRPALSAEDVTRLIGVRDGYSHAIIQLRYMFPSQYDVIPAHHTRKIAAREASLAPLRELLRRYQNKLHEIQKAISSTSGSEK